MSRRPRGIYFWAWGMDEKGKPFIYGPELTKEKVEEQAWLQSEGGDFEVYPLPTINEVRATKMIKAKRGQATNSLSKAMERLSHKYQNRDKRNPIAPSPRERDELETLSSCSDEL